MEPIFLGSDHFKRYPDLFFVLNTMPSNKETQFAYISLDCNEGMCVGHWIWECAFFLPAIKELRKKLPLKILLNEPKMYKKNILSDFGFYESDIVYSNKLEQFPIHNHGKCIYPEESEFLLYVPNILYLWSIGLETSLFFECLNSFRNYYVQQLPDLTKSIPISYIARSRKENYTSNYREFINKEKIENLLQKKGVNIIYTDSMTSFVPQFYEILKSKVIIIEMGSAFTINVSFIASNSHIIVLNDTWDYYNCNNGWFHVLRKLVTERNNTVEIFSKGHWRDAFTIDKDKLEKRVSDILIY